MKDGASGVVTVMFTDLVDSTALGDRLGDDRFSALLHEHLGVIEDAAARHGGTVVKTVGDGLMVVFSSAAEAGAAAVEVQRATAARNRRADVPIAVRIGIHLGEAEHAEGDYFGTPVVVASRLCAAAQGGQILASEVLRAIVGSRGGLEFRTLGPLELKGLEEPVAACEILWEPPGDTIPLPPALREDAAPVAGRDEERARLRELLEGAGRGRRTIAFLSGEPGIGKTRLASELAFEAHAAGCTVLFGRCDEEAVLPYRPFVEALRHLAEHRPEDTRAIAPDLAQLIPDLHPDAPQTGIDPETQRWRLFDGVAKLISHVAGTGPVLLVLDDLHWADRPTLALLRHLARDPTDAAVLILGTYRDVELDRSHPFADTLGDLRRDTSFERIRLRGLTEEGVGALLGHLAGHELDEQARQLARTLHEETGGNPFFVREILRHLVETGVLLQRDGRWTSDHPIDEIGLPESVREVIGRRLNRLSEDCSDVLQIASILGPDFDLDLLARLSGRTEDEVGDLLDEAVRAGGVVEEAPDALGRYAFVHALVRETLYGELTTNRRVRLHRRAGEAIEELRADDLEPHLAELARHFGEAAALAGTDKAVDYARRAGDRALRQLAFEEATTHLERAVQILDLEDRPDPEMHCELLLELGEAYRLALDMESARRVCAEAVEIARREGWPERLARAALTSGGIWIDVGLVRPDFIDLLEEAIRLLPEGHHLRPALHGRLAMELFTYAHSEERDRHSALAVTEARRLEDPRALAYALIARRHAVTGPARLEERLAITTEAIELARSIGDPDLELRARAFRMIEELEGADIGAFDEELAIYRRMADETRQPVYLYTVDLFRLAVDVIEGRLVEAEAAVPHLRKIAEQRGRLTPIVATSVQRAEVAYLRGTSADLDGFTIDVMRGMAQADPQYEAFDVRLDLQLGRTVEARDGLERYIADRLPDLSDHWLTLSVLFALAEAAEAFHHRPAAEALYEPVLPYADRICVAAGTAVVSLLGTMADVLGIACELTGRTDEAIERYEHAVGLTRRMRAHPFAVRSSIRLARALLQRGAGRDRERAEMLLDEALTSSDRMGLGAPFVEEARTLRSP